MQEVYVNIFVVNGPSILGVVLVDILHECSGRGTLSGASTADSSGAGCCFFSQSFINSSSFGRLSNQQVAKDFRTFHWVGCSCSPHIHDIVHPRVASFQRLLMAAGDCSALRPLMLIKRDFTSCFWCIRLSLSHISRMQNSQNCAR